MLRGPLEPQFGGGHLGPEDGGFPGMQVSLLHLKAMSGTQDCWEWEGTSFFPGNFENTRLEKNRVGRVWRPFVCVDSSGSGKFP